MSCWINSGYVHGQCCSRIVSVVGKEWRNLCSQMSRVVIRKLGDGEKVGPVVLLVIAVDSYILFEGLIRVFCLTIAFRMISRSEVEGHVECFAKRLEEA